MGCMFAVQWACVLSCTFQQIPDPMYTQVSIGRKYTETFRTYVQRDGKVVSPFHDIPAYPGPGRGVIHVVNEIPRFENAKFEISKSERMNPISQDVKKGKVRFVHNIFPMKGYPWNYGAVPQTWEDPGTSDEFVGKYGDGDPIDVVEIGMRSKKTGEVYQAKILGCLALIDSGECDWKVIAIDVEDEDADSLSCISDVQSRYPDLLDLTFRWFRDYKIPSGSPENSFGFGGEFKDRDLAEKVVHGAHLSWIKLMDATESGGISRLSSTLLGTRHHANENFVIEGCCEPAGDLPSFVGEYHYPARSG